MKTIAVFVALIAVALAGPVQRRQAPNPYADVTVVSETPLDNIGIDGYRFGYALSDGSTREESAQVETRSAEESILRVQGSYSYVGPDGQTYTVTYTADENGFHPQGAHIPALP